MIPVLINKDVFEPSDDYLKFMIQKPQLLLDELNTSAYQSCSVFLGGALHGAVGPMATLSNKKSINSQIGSSAVAYKLSMHKALQPVHQNNHCNVPCLCSNGIIIQLLNAFTCFSFMWQNKQQKLLDCGHSSVVEYTLSWSLERWHGAQRRRIHYLNDFSHSSHSRFALVFIPHLQNSFPLTKLTL